MKRLFIKRAADMLEKIAVASFAIGVFQGKMLGVWIAGISATGSFMLTYWEGLKCK